MLFNLTFEECYPCKSYKHAIYCSKNSGPQIGFKELGRGYSHANRKAYQIPECYVNLLTDEVSVDLSDLSEFTMMNIEVWELILLD